MYKELKESMMIMTQWMENSVNYKREQNRIEKCNNWNEKLGRPQQQIRDDRRKNWWACRSVKIILYE